MTARNSIIALAAIAGTACAANAQIAQVVFTDRLTGDVNLLDTSNPGSFNTLTSFGANARIAEITKGPQGAWFVTSAPFPIQDPSTASVRRIDDLFGTPVQSTVASSDPMQDPVGIKWDRRLNRLLVVDNQDDNLTQPQFAGVLGVGLGGSVDVIYQDDDSQPAPRFQAGTRLAKVPNSNDWYATSTFGGAVGGGPGGSQIYTLSVNPNTLQGSMDLLVDLSDTSVTGLGESLSGTRGVTVDPNTGNLYVVDFRTDGLYEITVDGNGDFAGISQLLSGLNDPVDIIYNEFDGNLIFSDTDQSSVSPNPKIWSVNLDGTGLTELASGVSARGLALVPAPSTLGLLGLGTLVAARRRR